MITSDQYITKQVAFMSSPQQAVRDDALYRIASYLDFIPPGIDELRPAIREMTLQWLYGHGYLVDEEA